MIAFVKDCEVCIERGNTDQLKTHESKYPPLVPPFSLFLCKTYANNSCSDDETGEQMSDDETGEHVSDEDTGEPVELLLCRESDSTGSRLQQWLEESDRADQPGRDEVFHQLQERHSDHAGDSFDVIDTAANFQSVVLVC